MDYSAFMLDPEDEFFKPSTTYPISQHHIPGDLNFHTTVTKYIL
jgi:hypothetical protein